MSRKLNPTGSVDCFLSFALMMKIKMIKIIKTVARTNIILSPACPAGEAITAALEEILETITLEVRRPEKRSIYAIRSSDIRLCA